MNRDRFDAGQRQQIESWIQEAKSGSATALGQLLEACRTSLDQCAKEALGVNLRVKCSASDLVQETSLDAHRDFVDFRGQRLEELLAWLRAILMNNALAAVHRYETSQKRQLSREVFLDAVADIAGEVADDAPSPRSLLVTIEERDSVERALERLTDDQRQVVLLHSREHCTFAEIGTRMQRSADAARKLWARAIERLQQELKKDADESS